MRRGPARVMAAPLAFAFLAASCLGGGGGPKGSAAELADRPASKVMPPKPLDTKRTGLPGMFVATNSGTWERLLKSPGGKGAVVLFVEPGGPSDGLGIARGDVIVSVDGDETPNHQRALTSMHVRPGQTVNVKVKRKDGSTRTVKIKPQEPRVRSVRAYLNPLIEANPNDPVLLYVRAQTPGTPRSRLQDLDKALKLDNRFVDALNLAATLLWDNRPRKGSSAQVINAALDGFKRALQIEPQNATVLAIRSTIYSSLGNGSEGRRDAEKARDIDPALAQGYFALAFADVKLRRTGDAAGPAAAAVTLDPFNAQYWAQLARVFKALKRKADCRKTTDAFAPFLRGAGLGREADSLRSICTK